MRYNGWTLLAFFGLAMMSATASAENALTYNGSYCKPYFGQQSGNFVFANYLKNATSSARLVTCPVVVDEISVTSGTTRAYAHVSGNGYYYCLLYSVNRDGTIRQSKTATRHGTGWLYLPDITTDDYFGSYTMICNLPGYGRLDTVWIGEKS